MYMTPPPTLAPSLQVRLHKDWQSAVDENNNPINYQIAFSYSETDDTITINLLFANAEDEDTTISFPLVFHRDI